MAARKRVGLLGAFSIDNAGDALLGYAGRQALASLCPDAELLVFAPRLPGASWRHDGSRARGIDREITLVPASTDLSWAKDLDALIIGGGGILNPAPAFRPFLLGDPARWDPARPAAWSALCSQGVPWYGAGLAEGYAAVRACCERLRYVSVRNQTSLTFLRRCGYEGPAEVVPDPALLLEPAAGPDAAVDEALRGVDRSRRLIGLSVGKAILDERARPFFRGLFDGLRAALRDREPTELLLIPFGNVYDDEALQRAAAAALPEARLVGAGLQPLSLFRLVGQLDLYIATRYHAMLAAFAQDVPFLVLDEYLSDTVASSKVREFVVEAGLEPLYLCPYLSVEPGWKLGGALSELAALTFRPTLGRMRQRLWRHYEAMTAALGLR